MRLLPLIAIVLAAAFAPAFAAAPGPIVVTGETAAADGASYREVPFTVPRGVTRITVTTPGSDHGGVSLGVADADGLRGWSGGARNDVTLSANDATPGYRVGPIVPGPWKLVLGFPPLQPGARLHYEARIAFVTGPLAGAGDKPLREGPGWYRGDFHVHTGFTSDILCPAQSGAPAPCPAIRSAEAAARRGLDFIAVTDRNTTSHFAALRELQPAFDRLLLIPGEEVTTYYGHANVFGLSSLVDFRIDAGRPISTILDQVERQGAVLSINHPGEPAWTNGCTGCRWTAPGTDFGRVQAVEVVNGGFQINTKSAEGRYQGIDFWQAQLSAGQRITAIGGSDNHDPAIAPGGFSAIGQPTTVVYAAALSTPAILDGLRSGRVFVDVEGTRDRSLDLEAAAGDRRAVMGQTLSVRPGETVHFQARIAGVAAGRLEIVVDGSAAALLADPNLSAAPTTAAFAWTADAAPHWIRLNVRSAGGDLLLLGNPIYLRPNDLGAKEGRRSRAPG